MSQKSAKKKAKKAGKAGADPSVLGNLRATRPTRIGGERRASAKPAAATATEPKASKPAAAKRKSPAATKAGPAARKSPAATKPVVKTAPRTTTRTPPPPLTEHPGGPPRGTEIVTTAVQAAGELAQIGLTAGGRLIKRAAKRIPRP